MILIKTKTYPFRDRAPEWILSIGLLLMGVMYSLHPEIFHVGFYAPLLNIMPYESWVFTAIMIGIFRLLALSINGLWRPTAHLRAIGAACGVTIWFSLLVISILSSGARPLGIPIFGMLLVFDFMALWWAAGDAKLVDAIAKRAREINGSSSD